MVSGSTKWPDGVFLKFTSGDQLGPINMVNVKPLEPGETTDVSVNMMSPSKIGIFQGQWRMCTTVGQYFGGTVQKLCSSCVRYYTLLPLTFAVKLWMFSFLSFSRCNLGHSASR